MVRIGNNSAEPKNYSHLLLAAVVMKILAENALKMENLLFIVCEKTELLEEYFASEGSYANTS